MKKVAVMAKTAQIRSERICSEVTVSICCSTELSPIRRLTSLPVLSRPKKDMFRLSMWL